MCGILGITKFKTKQLYNLREGLKSLAHRGPDQWNEFYDSNVYLGHRRLSILDLSENGKQPMMNSDEDVIITVNGEIYNFLKLKKELEELGILFKSESDSEVILYGYIEWGIQKLLEKIDGMYAFSIYDIQSNQLYLCRDRVGIKPLYYALFNEQIAWSSELKGIEKIYENINLEYDYTAFYDFLTYLYIPTPKTMYKSVYKLEPAHYLSIDLSTHILKKIKYWALEVGYSDDSFEKAKEKVFTLISNSVKEQMVSDVPVGFFLSGGMDSSSVVYCASKNSNNLTTFSIGFQDIINNEIHYAKLISDKFSSNHYQKMFDENSIENSFDNIKKWYDEPFADTSCFPTYLVSQLAKERSTVVLTGDGGDEIFGGYNWYSSFHRLKKYQLHFLQRFKYLVQPFKLYNNIIGRMARRLEIQFLLNDLELYTKLMKGMLKEEKENYRQAWGIDDNYDDYWYFRKFYKHELPLYTRLQYLDFHTYLHDDILTKLDRVSMAVSLECRVPLLSKELIEYSFSLKEEIRIYKARLKGIMKEAFRGKLPDEIIDRDKKGFGIPASVWSSFLKKNETREEKILNTIFGIKI